MPESVQFCGICSATARLGGKTSQAVFASRTAALFLMTLDGSGILKKPGAVGAIWRGKTGLVPLDETTCTLTTPSPESSVGMKALTCPDDGTTANKGDNIPLNVTEKPRKLVAGNSALPSCCPKFCRGRLTCYESDDR